MRRSGLDSTGGGGGEEGSIWHERSDDGYEGEYVHDIDIQLQDVAAYNGGGGEHGNLIDFDDNEGGYHYGDDVERGFARFRSPGVPVPDYEHQDGMRPWAGLDDDGSSRCSEGSGGSNTLAGTPGRGPGQADVPPRRGGEGYRDGSSDVDKSREGGDGHERGGEVGGRGTEDVGPTSTSVSDTGDDYIQRWVTTQRTAAPAAAPAAAAAAAAA
eukprot:CAMPEP_0181375668 /NCGR_PEP_ID=MMETSP1106-20121128/16844_1 /TAXON_ID=81844 /ORGANISM="Mantoniella antarctica, Strain SL-175" /LENGTH=212 /DNA_ID=CAMNT_0023494067 /DNA_START=33 /DNA_END=667 /DNA_ORIENTATION=-